MILRFFIAAAVIILATCSARAEVLTVGDGGQFASIGNAIANAHTGDTIRVLAGTY